MKQSFFLLAALVASILLNANSAMAQSISFTRLSGSGDVAISPSQDGIVFVADEGRQSEFYYVIDGTIPSTGILTIGSEFATVVPTTAGDHCLTEPIVLTRDEELAFAFVSIPTEFAGTEAEELARDSWASSNSAWQTGRFGWGWQESLGEFLAVNVLIPIVGVDNLANASDATLVTGTVIASVPIAVGIVAGGEVVLGVGTVGALTSGGGSVAVATGVTVTEGTAATMTIIIATEGAAVGTGTTIVGASGPSVVAVGSTVFPTTSVVTGSSTVVFGHGVRHLVGTALSQAPVEAAIAGSASEVAATGVTAGTFNVIVNGITIEYRMAIIDGIIRIGTYFPL